MGKQKNAQPEETVSHDGYESVIYGLTEQLEALARVLTHVETEGEEQAGSITRADFVCIMQIFQEKLESLKDLAGTLEGAIEKEEHPTPTMQAV